MSPFCSVWNAEEFQHMLVIPGCNVVVLYLVSFSSAVIEFEAAECIPASG